MLLLLRLEKFAILRWREFFWKIKKCSTNFTLKNIEKFPICPHFCLEVGFVSNSLQPAEIQQSNPKTFLPKYLPVQTVHEVTPQIAEAYSAFLKTKSLAVDTHNRKIKRVRKVFDVLKDYYAHGNPFHAKSLLRSEREEQGTVVRRLAFTREEEQALLRELNNPKRKLINKPETIDM